ncbi:hypothetical protein LIP_1715 [Limnochorda pilosa]|uniref:SLH domain-containing protein n=1 Tax=Limnochorda pilosa TaxID=1555112 RepID=A0A0K2SKC3_LIMPI|nr:hypothetical protein LIP_1715 [Limnochorda pilosa]
MALTLLVLAPAPLWAQEQTIRDVPSGHWAYEAVRRLIDEGYLTLYDDRTFRGDQPVDRYTFAAAIARILDQVGSGAATPSSSDVQVLKDLATEFRQELRDWYQSEETLTQRIQAAEKSVAALDGTVGSVLAKVDSLEQAAAQRDANLKGLADQAGQISQDLAKLREDLGLQTGTLDQRLAEFQNQIEGDLGVQGINLGQNLADLSSRLKQTSERLAQQADVATQLQGQVDELQKSLQQQRQEMTGADRQLLAEIRDLANRLDVLQSTPGTVAGVQTRQLQLERQLATLQRDFDAYRSKAEEETRTLRTTSVVGVAAALVAVVAALVIK